MFSATTFPRAGVRAGLWVLSKARGHQVFMAPISVLADNDPDELGQ